MNIVIGSKIMSEIELLALEKNQSKEDIILNILKNGLLCSKKTDKNSSILIISPKNQKDKILKIEINQ